MAETQSPDLLEPVGLTDGESLTLFEVFRSDWLAERFKETFRVDVARSDKAGFFFTFDAARKRDGEPPLYLDLAEYFALRVSGKWRKFRGSERALWRLRLLAELGLVELPDLGMVVPDAPTAAIEKGLAGIELLLACRWVLWPRLPAVLARSLLAPWSGGISEYEARQAVLYARDCEPPFIRLLAQERAGGKLANLYVPAVAT